jgi:secondary thiamine-phosphate synthase enzyme
VKHHFENHDLVTERGSQLVDVTGEVVAAVERADVTNGMALVYSPHTTCAVVINEQETGFIDDFSEALAQLAPEKAVTTATTTSRSGLKVSTTTTCTPNGHSHLRAGILSSSSQTIPIVDGALMLGRWQRVFFCELDRSRPRKIFIQVIGE